MNLKKLTFPTISEAFCLVDNFRQNSFSEHCDLILKEFDVDEMASPIDLKFHIRNSFIIPTTIVKFCPFPQFDYIYKVFSLTNEQFRILIPETKNKYPFIIQDYIHSEAVQGDTIENPQYWIASLIAFAIAFRCSDLHSNNVIVRNGKPWFIDAETLFQWGWTSPRNIAEYLSERIVQSDMGSLIKKWQNEAGNAKSLVYNDDFIKQIDCAILHFIEIRQTISPPIFTKLRFINTPGLIKLKKLFSNSGSDFLINILQQGPEILPLADSCHYLLSYDFIVSYCAERLVSGYIPQIFSECSTGNIFGTTNETVKYLGKISGAPPLLQCNEFEYRWKQLSQSVRINKLHESLENIKLLGDYP